MGQLMQVAFDGSLSERALLDHFFALGIELCIWSRLAIGTGLSFSLCLLWFGNPFS